MHPEFRKYLLTRGLQEVKEHGCILIPHVCQHLVQCGQHVFTRSDGKEVIEPWYGCDIHNDPDRPEVCRKFHGQKMMKGARIYIPPNCAFRKDSI
jgi:hypothetical protein